jgi:hypothetical protein
MDVYANADSRSAVHPGAIVIPSAPAIITGAADVCDAAGQPELQAGEDKDAEEKFCEVFHG